MNAKARGGVGLVGITNSAVKTVGVGDEEDTKEDEVAISAGDDLGNGLYADNSRRDNVTDSVGRGRSRLGVAIGAASLFVVGGGVLVVGRRCLILDTFWRGHFGWNVN